MKNMKKIQRKIRNVLLKYPQLDLLLKQGEYKRFCNDYSGKHRCNKTGSALRDYQYLCQVVKKVGK